jgi:lipopolysaccharide transport system permease protein
MLNQTKLIIEPNHIEKNYWKDLWLFRELFYILSRRDITARYKQTVLGVVWALIKPLITMIVFTVVFGKLAKLPTEGSAPYAILVFAAMLPWSFFAASLSEASNSLIGNAQLITKVYFPRLIIPTSSVITCCVDFLISLAILIPVMLYYRFAPTVNILALPVFLLMAFAAALGMGLYIGSLNVKYRDFRHVVPFIVQFGLYVSPVGFSSSIIPEQYRLLYNLNPMVAVIDGFRWAIIGQGMSIYWPGLLLSVGIISLFLFMGINKFRSMEKSFADTI